MAAFPPPPNSTSSPVPPAFSPTSSPPPASSSPPPSTPPPALPPSSTPPPASPPPFTPPPASPPPSNPPPASPPPSTPPTASPPQTTPPPVSPPQPSAPPPSPPPPSTTPPLSSPAPVSAPPPSTLSPASPPPRNGTSPDTSPLAPSQSPPTNVISPPSTNPPSAPPPEPAKPPPSSSGAPPQSPPGTPISASPPPSPVPPSAPPNNPPVKSSPPPTSVNPPTSSPPPPPSSHGNAPPNGPPPSPSQVSNPPPASGPPNKSPPPPVSPPPTALPPTKLPTPPSNASIVSPPSNFPPTIPPPPISLSAPSPGTSPSLPSLPVPSNGANNNTRSTTSSNSSSSNGGKGIGTGGTIAIGLIFGLLLIGSVGLAAWCIRKQKKRGSGTNNGSVLPTSAGSSAQPDSSLLKFSSSATDTGTASSKDYASTPTEPGGLGNSRSWFTYEELAQATDGFAEQNLLGEGGFGSVYKGRLADGRVVAVKQLKIGGGQGEREFKAEVEIIGRINHRNLVSLVGYCISESRRMLVYEYVPNNTLYFHLHGQGRPVMDWAMRVKVAVGAARGLAYLHEDCIPRIIHRDIKSSNILLDDNFEARVSDFGLAKLFELANTHVTTRVMGTFGYMAPEYAASGKLTEKSDVFSFGVVLLEMITGRKPVDASQPLGDESLVEWARPLLSHAIESQEFEHLVDPKLERNYVDTEMFRLIEVAAACVRHSSAKRPHMGQVIRAFDTMSNWGNINNGMRVGESEIMNSPLQSEEIRLFRRMAFGNQAYSTDFFTGTGTGTSFFTINSRLDSLGQASQMSDL